MKKKKRKNREKFGFYYYCFSLPGGCCGIGDFEVQSGDCAHTSQSVADRWNRTGRRSESTMDASAADSWSRTCAGRSPGTLYSAEM